MACSVEGCQKEDHARGYCEAHYRRVLKFGDPLRGGNLKRQPGRVCSVVGCDKPHHSLGYCRVHYSRCSKHGDPHIRLSPKGDAQDFLSIAVSYDGDDCLLWPFGRDRDGYGTAWNGKKTTMAHAIICERVHGEPTDGQQVAHSCGRGRDGCVSPRHLRWATPVENSADRARHGTTARGERGGTAKLSEESVLAIRAISGIPQQAIAERFGVSQALVSKVMRRQLWRHV